MSDLIVSENRVKALAQFLDCDPEEITPEPPFGDQTEAVQFSGLGDDYTVFTQEEADEAAKRCVLETAWAFNSYFLRIHLREEVFENVNEERVMAAFDKMREGLCEDANPLVLALIEDKEEFVNQAIAADGRGRFLSSYDGREHEEQVKGAHWEAIKKILGTYEKEPMIEAAMEACDGEEAAPVLVCCDWLAGASDDEIKEDVKMIRALMTNGYAWYFIYRN